MLEEDKENIAPATSSLCSLLPWARLEVEILSSNIVIILYGQQSVLRLIYTSNTTLHCSPSINFLFHAEKNDQVLREMLMLNMYNFTSLQ